MRNLITLAALAAVAPLAAQDDQQNPNGGLRATPTPNRGFFAAATAAGFDLTIVHINAPGHPTNVVPGLGVPFSAGGGSTTAFQRPFLSATGQFWAIEADADTGSTTDDNVYLLNGALVLQEGQQAPWAPTGETVGTLDDRIGVNSLGELLVTNNTGGTAVTTADDYVARRDTGGNWVLVAREGDLVDPILPVLAGATWDDAMNSAWLTDTGLAGWEAAGVDGTPGGTADDTFVVLGNALLAAEGQIPSGQANGASAAWENFDFDDWFVSADGLHWLAQGDTDAATTEDDVLVYDGVVVLQEDQPIPGGPFAEPIDGNGIVNVWLDHAGNWYARGNNDGTEQDWVVRNGVVVATSDANDPIIPGSTEFWDDTDFGSCFFAHDGNAAGAFVIGGVTNAPSDQNGVLVFDDGQGGRVVVCREGDPIDLDGNGQFDDDRFFNTFGNDDVRVLPDNSIWFVATVRDGTGTAVDQGLFQLQPAPASCTFRNGSGVNPADYACTNNPVLGQTWNSTIVTNANTVQTAVLLNIVADPGTPSPFGEFLVATAPEPLALSANGAHAIPLPYIAPLIGAELPTQGLRVETRNGFPVPVLLNALDLVVGR